MPIKVDDLVKRGKEVSTEKNQHRQKEVLAFMKKNPETAFTQAEVAKELSTTDSEMRPQQARQILFALQKKGHVDRKEVQISETQRSIFWALASKISTKKPGIPSRS